MESMNLHIPLIKSSDSRVYHAILSDTSLDRDGELISPDLIKEWGSNPNQYLPMLVDHANKVENLVGKWVNPNVIMKEFSGREGYALQLTPKWYESNPKAQMIKGMIEEDGAQIGLSIGAIPLESKMVEVNGKKHKMWTKARLVEGSLTPVAANANCLIVAKSYEGAINKALLSTSNDVKLEEAYDDNPEEITDEDLKPKTQEVELTKPKQVEECVKSIMADPKFKPQAGRTKEESAWAICQSKVGKSYSYKEKKMEEIIMPEDEINDPVPEPEAPEEVDKFAKLEAQIAKMAKLLETKKAPVLNREAELKLLAPETVNKTVDAPMIDKALPLSKMLFLSRGVLK